MGMLRAGGLHARACLSVMTLLAFSAGWLLDACMCALPGAFCALHASPCRVSERMSAPAVRPSDEKRTTLARQLLARAEDLNASLIASSLSVQETDDEPVRNPPPTKSIASVKAAEKRLVAEEEVRKLRESAARAQKKLAAARQGFQKGASDPMRRKTKKAGAAQQQPGDAEAPAVTEASTTPEAATREEPMDEAAKARQIREEGAIRVEIERMREQLQRERMEVRHLRERELALAGVLSSIMPARKGRPSRSMEPPSTATASHAGSTKPAAAHTRVRWAAGS